MNKNENADLLHIRGVLFNIANSLESDEEENGLKLEIMDLYFQVNTLIKAVDEKPEYTKAMRDTGELPPVGSMVKDGTLMRSQEVIFNDNKGWTCVLDEKDGISLCLTKRIKPIQTQEEIDIEAIKARLANIQIAYMEDGTAHRDMLATSLHNEGFTLKEGGE